MEFKEQKLAQYLQSHGFNEFDGRVKSTLIRIVKRLVSNMINNARYVADACNCKTIKASHFKAVDQLMRKMIIQAKPRASPGKQVGGKAVLPSEYFGINSGSYFTQEVVAPGETHAFSDPTLTRVGHNIFDGQIGGYPKLKTIVTSDMVDAVMAEYNNRRSAKTPLALSKGANALVRMSIHQNLADILGHIMSTNRGSKLTGVMITKTTANHPQYEHMA
jgi:hypothetical protein